MPTEKYAKLSVTSKTGTVTNYDVYSYMTPDMNSYLQFMLRTDDYAGVKKVFKDIASLTVVNEAGLECYSTNSYTELNYISLGTTMNSLGEDAITLRLKNQSLEEKVEKLQEQINPTVNEEQMSVDEFRTRHLMELDATCNEAIINGMDVETSKGKQHFSYKDEDQRNLKTLFDTAMATQMDVPYHADGCECTLYSWQELVQIYVALQTNLLYHTTYINALHSLVRGLNSKEQIKAVTYGQAVEGKISESMKAALAQGQAVMDAILIKAGLKKVTEETAETAK